MISLSLSHKLIPVVAALSVLTLTACSEEASAPLTDEQISAVKEQLAPVASVAVAGKSVAAPAKAPVKAAPEPAPAESVPTTPEPAPSAAETPVAPAKSTAPEPAVAAETAPSAPVEAAPAAPAASDALALATNNGCMACHKIDVMLVGPAYKDVSAKYKDDPAALDTLVAKVKAGGVGAWGQIPMPPNGHVSDADIKTIVTWVLVQ
jgi:cytochrome c